MSKDSPARKHSPLFYMVGFNYVYPDRLEFNDIIYQHIDLHKADLTQAIYSKVDFSHGKLSYADMRWSNILRANFSHANLSHVDMRFSTQTDIFTMLSIDKELSKMVATTRAQVKRSRPNAGAEGYLNTDHLIGLTFDDELLHMDNAIFKNANLYRTKLGHSDLPWADFSYAKMKHSDLSGCNFRKASFEHADLRDALLIGADIRETKFTDSDLRGAKLTYTKVTDATSFLGVYFDLTTQLPFSYLKAFRNGMIFYDETHKIVIFHSEMLGIHPGGLSDHDPRTKGSYPKHTIITLDDRFVLESDSDFLKFVTNIITSFRGRR